jgi:hypothetical protein
MALSSVMYWLGHDTHDVGMGAATWRWITGYI